MNLDRRELLKMLGLSGVGALLPSVRAQGMRPPRPALRVAFVTDIHLPSDKYGDHVRRVLKMVQSQFNRVDMILFGGDNVLAAENSAVDASKSQLSNWQKMCKETLTVPNYSVIGNHDIWYPPGAHSSSYNTGKQMAIEAFQMPQRYYSVSRSGWRFLMLDSVHPKEQGYQGLIDEDQMAWLKRELERNKQPTILVSHIPIFTAAPLLDSHLMSHQGHFRISHQRILKNARELTELIRVNPHVRMCLSGHLHMDEQIQYRQTTFLCGGSVCGSWWKGEYEHFSPGYYLIDLFENGFAFAKKMSLKMPT